MTPRELRATLDCLDLSAAEAGHLLGVHRATVYRWLDGSTSVPIVVELLLRLMVRRGIRPTDEETREVVEAHEKARGYEIGKGQYLLVEDDELEAIEIASTHTIDIDSFVPRAEIDQRFFDAPYYIT